MQGELVYHHHYCAMIQVSQVSMEPNRPEKQEPLTYIPSSLAVSFLAFLFFSFSVSGFVNKVKYGEENSLR